MQFGSPETYPDHLYFYPFSPLNIYYVQPSQIHHLSLTSHLKALL